MKSTVVWQPVAIQKLATLWNQAADRNAISVAAHQIETLLSRDPHTQGESRIGTQRVGFVPPLGFRFDVILDDCQVRVLAVWLVQAV